MSVPAPHFLLFSTARSDRPPHEAAAGQWRFVLEATDGSAKLEASDAEAEISRDRLELLAIVRGLEALDQPSQVTVVTASRYISRGLRYGLPAWRENGWQWERFDELAPVKNADLWQRIDHAMQFHKLHCRFREKAAGRTEVVAEPQVKTYRVDRPTPAAPSKCEHISAALRMTSAPRAEREGYEGTSPHRKKHWRWPWTRFAQTIELWMRSFAGVSRPRWRNAPSC